MIPSESHLLFFLESLFLLRLLAYGAVNFVGFAAAIGPRDIPALHAIGPAALEGFSSPGWLAKALLWLHHKKVLEEKLLRGYFKTFGTTS